MENTTEKEERQELVDLIQAIRGSFCTPLARKRLEQSGQWNDYYQDAWDRLNNFARKNGII